MKRLVKLVRDRVARNQDGTVATYEQILSHPEYIQQLRAKLVEEAVEYIQNPCTEELADVLEVVRALCNQDLKYDLTVLESARAKKYSEKGGFQYGIGLYVELKDLPKFSDKTRAEIQQGLAQSYLDDKRGKL